MNKFNQMLRDANASIIYYNLMATEIKCEQTADDLILVNGKEVRKDMNGNWIGRTLDLREAKFFSVFLYTVRQIAKGKHIEATYRV